MSGMPHIAERNFTEDQRRSTAAVSETIKKCNCMPTCSHKFCGCPAHYWEPERDVLSSNQDQEKERES